MALLILTPVSLIAAVADSDNQTTPREPVSAEAQLSWELRDHLTNAVLAQGYGSFSASDLCINERVANDGTRFYRMWYGVGEGFQVGVSVYPEERPEDCTGFGMWLSRPGYQTFSWDWFNCRSGSTAIKLQGGGRVAYDLEQVGSKWRMTSIRVLEDVVLRCTDGLNDEANVVGNASGVPYRWSCTLYAGTEIPLSR